MNKQINLSDFKIATLIIILSFLLQPLVMLYTQNYLAPKLLGQNQAENSAAIGSSIYLENLNLRGNKDAEIFLVEYSDYECPFCKSFHNTAKSVLEESNGKIAWVYKHFPLPSHQNAIPAAIASECVAKIGGSEKFWKFSDTLFASQNNLSATALANYAKMLGINMSEYNNCITKPEIAAKVDADMQEGSMFGVQGTPNTFVAKKVDSKLIFLANINGAQPKVAVDAIIKEVKNMDPDTVKGKKDNSFFGKIKVFLGF